MKKLIFILLILLSGCAGIKKVEKTTTQATTKTDTEVKKSTDEKSGTVGTMADDKTSNKNTDQSETKNKVTETKTTDYDPSKAIVPGTGKPPVLKETVKTETELNQKDTKIQESLTEKLNYQINCTKVLQTKCDSL